VLLNKETVHPFCIHSWVFIWTIWHLWVCTCIWYS